VVRTGQQVWFDTGALSTLTLIAGPVTKEGWINIYPNRVSSLIVFHTRQDAENSASNKVIDTLKINWTE
jgi:hypothetical protein